VTATQAPPLPDWTLTCGACGATRDASGLASVCDCGQPWLVRYPSRTHTLVDRAEIRRGHGMWRFRAFLPILPAEEPISLGEGDTPLLAVPRLGRAVSKTSA
jgi:threonine synthase